MWKYIVIGVGGLMVLVIGGSLLSTFSSVVTAPSRVIERTLKTDNIINNYEWFHDMNAAYEARLNQISEFEGLQSESTDNQDKRMLRTELSAMRQNCRDVATRYNANSEKLNTTIFKGWSLPEVLSQGACG